MLIKDSLDKLDVGMRVRTNSDGSFISSKWIEGEIVRFNIYEFVIASSKGEWHISYSSEGEVQILPKQKKRLIEVNW